MGPNPLVGTDRIAERSSADAARAMAVFLGEEQPSRSQVGRYAAPSGPEIVERVLNSSSFGGSALAALVAGYPSPKRPDEQPIVSEADVAWAYELLSCTSPSASEPAPWNRFMIAFLTAPDVAPVLRSAGVNPAVLDQVAPLGGPEPVPHELAFLHAALLGGVPSAPWSGTDATLLREAAAILGSEKFRDQILVPLSTEAKLPHHALWTDGPRWPFRAAAQRLLVSSLELTSRDVRDTWPRYIVRLVTHEDSLLTRLLALEPDLLRQANASDDRLSAAAEHVAAAREALGQHDAVVGTRFFTAAAREELVEAMQRIFLQREPRPGHTKALARLPAELALRRLISDQQFLTAALDPLRAGREPTYEGPQEALLDSIHLLDATVAEAVGSRERSGRATSGHELRRFLLAPALRRFIAAQRPLEDAERYVVEALTALADVTQQGQDEPRIRLWISRRPGLKITVQSALPGDHEVVLNVRDDTSTELRAPLVDPGTGVAVAELNIDSEAVGQRLVVEGTVAVRRVDASRDGDEDESSALTIPFRYHAGGPAFVSEALVLLHGKRRASSTGPAGATVADFLDRVLAAPAFSSHVAEVGATVLTGSDADFRRLDSDVLAPLGDPERPYLAALTQRAQSGGSPAARTLLTLLSLRRAVSAAGDADSSELLATLVRDAGQRRDADALNAFALAARAGVQFEPEHPARAPAPDDARVGEIFVRRSLELSSQSLLLEATDRRTLVNLAAISGRDGTVILGTPHPVAVDLPEALDDADAERWRHLAERGHLSHTPSTGRNGGAQVWVLAVDPAAGLTPLALACLACRPLGHGPLGISAQATPGGRSWAATAIGYDMGDSTPTVHVGRIALGHTAERAVDDIVLATIPGQAAGAPVDDAQVQLEHAFALVLRCDPDVDVTHLVNIECCAVFDDTDALIDATANAGRRLRRKPVIMVGTRTPRVSSYVIDSVHAYWVYGGLCAVMGVGLHYDRKTASFTPFAVTKPRLAPLASPQLTTLPLGDLIDADPTEQATIKRAPFVPRQGLTVLHPPPYPVTEATTASLLRTHSATRFDRADHERFCIAGEVDRFLLASVDVAQLWPVAHLVAEGLATSRHWESLTERFLAQPSVRNAQQVLDTVDVSSGDAWYLSDALDRFAVVLTSRPDIALGLTPSALRELLRLVRQTPSFDLIVAQLAAFADDVAAKDYSLVVPLFELLACGLPASNFNSVLGFAARSMAGARQRSIHRLAESIRRFGDPQVAALALVAMSTSDGGLLDSKEFLRCFDRILDSPAANPVRSRYGRELLERIASSTDPIKVVRQLVGDGDRDGLRAFLGSLDRLQGVDPQRLLDELRGFSNELRNLPLATDELAFSKGYGLHHRKIAAIVFSDIPALEGLAAGGHFETRGDLSAVGRSMLGDNSMLNEMVAERFPAVDARSFELTGQTCVEVYANASASVAEEDRANAEEGKTGPLVSVAVSAFNPDIPLMREALRSIAAQSHSSVEVFVVDDASDQTISSQIASLLEEFKDFELIRLDENCGPYVGRNVVLERAKGDFIAIQDADDWSHPIRFAMQLACLAHAPEIRVVTTPHVRIDQAGVVQLEAGFKVFGDGPMTSMFRRQVFEEIGAFAPIRSRGDVEMRERIRAYYGNHALEELNTPMMLCFAGSQTLSQRTKSQHIEYLRAFRTHIMQRRSLASFRREGIRPLGKEHPLVVPVPLRAPDLEAHG